MGAHRSKSVLGLHFLAVTVAILLVGPPAAAQSDGFALDRFEPSERGSDWFTADSLDLRGHDRWALGGVVDWAYNPLVVYDEDGYEIASIVSNQVYLHLGGSFVLLKRLRFAGNVPILVGQAGEATAVEGVVYEASDAPAFGDVRVSGDLRVWGEYGDPATVAVGLVLHVPSGDRAAYTGDGAARIVPRVQVAGEVLPFVYSARLALNGRLQDQSFAGAPFGTELGLAAAAGAKLLDNKLIVGPEVFTSTVLADGGAFEKVTTPVELLFGAHYDFAKRWRAGVAVGPGLTRGLGTPQVRTVASLEWREVIEPPPPPPPPPADTDGDGILDPDDACPDDPGPASHDSKINGCPLPPDTDEDGIPDPEDACPTVPGVPHREFPSLHGCPPPDKDGDGIPDQADSCPEEAGPPNEVEPEKHGCPPRDSDGDGILDDDDACPKQPGIEHPEDPKKHGCPKVIVEKGEIRILERIEFDTGRSTIRPESEGILQAVHDVLEGHPEITKIEVQGHTDNQGVPYFNKVLSQRRAAAVVAWLVGKGIAKGRLVPVGYGLERPIDTNETEEGRQNNRRVQFVILERSDAGDGSDEEAGQ